MIDPDNVTNFSRTEAESEEFLLFCLVVAGKSAHQQAGKLHDFLSNNAPTLHSSPFDTIRHVNYQHQI